MGRLVLAVVATVVIPTLAWADGADSRPGEQPAGAPAAKAPGDLPPIAAELKSQKQKGSYSIGYSVGTTLRRQIGTGSLDLSAFLLGMQQSLSGQKASLSATEQDKAFKSFIGDLQREKMKKTAEASESNKKKGEEFLEANKKQKGVTTLPSGLQYLVIKEGTGKQPKATDKVEVHYHGTLIDGTVFDSSVERGVPATFPVGRVIPGWIEALQLMKEGAKWKVVVPAKLAYGAEGPPGIGPNQTLIFEIELLKVK
ncbi:MAG TPA: FKBP-type peptidyl-prolyl cis-trans isomerase [Planctomycetaceae bacterium]|jgi:FKBP-type peptidyl-prolyl cis-trans isomerase|nr:FKBP-type peptidyl-prolyl cis-trans isomerase [Planctomycetaceae bacterium]